MNRLGAANLGRAESPRAGGTMQVSYCSMLSLSNLDDSFRNGIKERKIGTPAGEGYRYCSFLMSSSGLMKVL